MKRILRHFALEALALYIVTQIASGLEFANGTSTFLLASGAITLATLFGKPVINILLLPLNLVTFGLFRWVSSAVALYLVTLVVEGFEVVRFYFPGYDSKWIEIPEINFTGVLAFVAFSFLLSLFTSAFHWLRQ